MIAKIETVLSFPTVTTDDESLNSVLFSRSSSGIIIPVCPSKFFRKSTFVCSICWCWGFNLPAHHNWVTSLKKSFASFARGFYFIQFISHFREFKSVFCRANFTTVFSKDGVAYDNTVHWGKYEERILTFMLNNFEFDVNLAKNLNIAPWCYVDI